ncbi:hypothetical protein DICA3_C13630 [Diutina catenulata]
MSNKSMPLSPTKRGRTEAQTVALYKQKQLELKHHEKMVERLKFELMELSITMENDQLQRRIAQGSGHDVFRQAHTETSAHLRVLDEAPRLPERPLAPQNCEHPLAQLRKKASLLNDWGKQSPLGQELTRKTSQLNREVQTKTSQFFNEIVTSLSPQKAQRRRPSMNERLLEGTVLFDQDVTVVDIDDYDSSDDELVRPPAVVT